MTITINGNGTVTGISVGGLPDGIVDTDMLANNAVTVAKASGSAKGITMADQWRINTSYTFAASGTTYDITANWERNDSTGFGSIGTGMTESSGIFTFPQTGIYWVRLFATTYTATGSTTAITGYISAQKNGGGFAVKAQGSEDGHTTNAYGAMSLDFIFDVEDVSGDKVKMQAQSTGADRRILASSTMQRTGFTFIHLGDT